MPAFLIGVATGLICFCIGYGTACFMFAAKEREERHNNEVVHAEWIEDIYGFCKCSNCGRLEEINYDYCCDCGARMDKE